MRLTTRYRSVDRRCDRRQKRSGTEGRQSSDQVIFKTQTLDLDAREKPSTDSDGRTKFGVAEDRHHCPKISVQL